MITIYHLLSCYLLGTRGHLIAIDSLEMTAFFFVLSLVSILLTRGYFWLKVPGRLMGLLAVCQPCISDDMMLRMLQHRQGGESQGEPIPLDSLEPKREFRAFSCHE